METMNIPERCRDEQGYLIRQHLMTDIPYGGQGGLRLHGGL